MSKTLRKRAPETTNLDIDHRMKLYSAAAMAAGVGMMAMAQPAEGEVVITQKYVPIPISVYGGISHIILLDLNRDGINDFSFYNYSFAYHSFDESFRVTPLHGGAVVGAPGQRGVSYASALVQSAKIGPSAHFSSDNRTEIERGRGTDASSHESGKHYGNWGGNPRNRYLGVRFLINGQTHYGWVRLTVVTRSRQIQAAITEYAYETVPNKVITAGVAPIQETKLEDLKPVAPSLGMLALGSDGLAIWKREAASAAN